MVETVMEAVVLLLSKMKVFLFHAGAKIRRFVPDLLVLFSFVLPLLVLYILYPYSFQITWKGRALYIVFLWLFCLELVLASRRLELKFPFSNRLRALVTFVLMIVPTAYVVGLAFFGLNDFVIELGRIVGVPYRTFGMEFLIVSWPLSFEYVVFASLFTAIVFLAYTSDGLRRFSIALFFLWGTAFFYVLDTMAPFGVVGLLQAFVPFTANSAATVLRALGYQALTLGMADGRGPGTMLVTRGAGSVFAVVVYWPSAGIHSLFIYTLAILLFIKNAAFSVVRKAVYFVVGGVGTFLANVLRIVTICIIGVRVGSGAAIYFHDYLGELFFISWMIMYPLLIIYGPRLTRRLFTGKTEVHVEP